jgi:hypothetical protein
MFTSKTSYNGLDNPLYRPVEQSFIQSISIPLVTEYGADVAFNDSVFRTSRYHAFKRDTRTSQVFRHHGSLEEFYVKQSTSGGHTGPIYKESFR